MGSEVAIIGVGMHPFGRWGKSFVDLGLYAARAALNDAGLTWKEIPFLASGAATRCGTLGQLAARSFAEGLGWQGAQLSTSAGGCVASAQALAVARSQILAGQCEVALVVGADVVPAGVLGLENDRYPEDANHIRHYLGFTNPVYLGLEARRRMALYGTTEEDLAGVRVKNARHGILNSNARYRCALAVDQVKQSALVADPLRLLHICSTSDGAAAVVISSLSFARQRSRSFVILAGLSTASSTYPNPAIEMPHLASDSAAKSVGKSFKDAVIQKLYEQTGIGPADLSLAEVYDLSCASELDAYERMGLCGLGEAERLLRNGDTALGGGIPVNSSGGLASLGEAIAAQALAQVCEITWQLRGQAGRRQVPHAKAGLALSQATFDLGAALLLKR